MGTIIVSSLSLSPTGRHATRFASVRRRCATRACIAGAWRAYMQLSVKNAEIETSSAVPGDEERIVPLNACY